ADAGGDEGVEGGDLLLGSFGAAGDFVGLGAESVCGRGARGGERAIPVADLLPGVEGGPGYGRLVVGGLGGRFVFVFVLIGRRGLELVAGPVIDAAAIGGGDGGLEFRAPYLDIFVRGDVEGEGLRKNDLVGVKGEISPELRRSFGCLVLNAHLVVEGVSGAEAADGKLQDFEIGVERGLLGDGRGHVDGVRRRGAGGGSVGVGYGEIFKLGGLRGGGVGDGYDAELADSGFVLKLDA